MRGLEKVYAGNDRTPPKRALKGIDLAVPRGSIYGLLGPNGAGKSTFINILAGLVTKTSGEVNVWGFDIDRNPRNVAASIGVVPQELFFDAFFTPFETLELQAGMYGVPPSRRRTLEILRAVHLEEQQHAYARSLSGGMKRRLMVAKAMVHVPPILVLDEPTAGVDVQLRQQLWQNVREIHAQGVTIVLTTHYLEEAEELCDTIAIINHGEVVVAEPTETLLKRFDEKEIELVLHDDLEAVPSALAALGFELIDGRKLRVQTSLASGQMGELLNAVSQSGISIADIRTRETDLEDIFLQLTQS